MTTDQRTSSASLTGRDLVDVAAHPETAPAAAHQIVRTIEAEVQRTGVAWSDRVVVYWVRKEGMQQRWYGLRPIGPWGWVGILSVGTLREHPQYLTGRADSLANLGWSLESVDREVRVFFPTGPNDTSQRLVTFHWDLVLINLLLLWLVWRIAVLAVEWPRHRRARRRWARGECVECGYPVRQA